MAESTALQPDAVLMSATELTSRVEQLAATFVLASPDDLPALARLHTQFGELSGGDVPEPIARAARAMAARVEAIILGDCDLPGASLEIIGRTIVAVQRVVRDTTAPEQAGFPPEADQKVTVEGESGSASGGLSLSQELKGAMGDCVSELLDHMASVERTILELGADVPDADTVYAMFGAFHSVKGSAGYLGLTEVGEVAHAVESLLDAVHGGRVRWESQTLELVLTAVDRLRTVAMGPIGSRGNTGEDALPDESSRLIRQVQALFSGDLAEAGESTSPAAVPELATDPSLLADFVNEATEHLDSAEKELLGMHDCDPEAEAEKLNSVFRSFHTIKGVAGFLNLEPIRSFAHQAETLLDLARNGALRLDGSAVELAFESIDLLRRLVQGAAQGRIEPVDADGSPLSQELAERIGLLCAQAGGSRPVVRVPLAPLSPRPSAAETVAESVPVEAVTPSSPAARSGEPAAVVTHDADTQPAAPQVPAAEKPVQIKETLRLDSERVDHLVDAIGEMVIAELMVSQALDSSGVLTPELSRHLSRLSKISREVQAMGTSLRMVSVRSVFQKMSRLVRDLSRKLGKPISFTMSGEDTEIDKTVVEQIGDPLVHMLRNAIDHGIEADVEQRRSAGKPDAGHIELRAFHRGGSIYIEIQDDGRGLDRDAILQKAVRMRLVREGATLSEREVFNLITVPGFSTAERVTEISGRGVGMDVVRRNVEALRGQIEISSVRGKGTTFSMRLPITLAIIDGMIVKVGSERYIMPTLSLVRTVKPDPTDLHHVLSRCRILQEGGSVLPVVALADQLGLERSDQALTDGLILIVEAENRRVGILVDALLGKQQTVIKSLGGLLRNTPGVSGGAIMPDGNVSLILDVDGLVRMATRAGDPAAQAA